MRLLKLTALAALALLCATPCKAESEYWYQRTSLFEILPVTENDIVFLGNSITDGGEFAELFGNLQIKNRGISSDVMGGVEKRLDQVLRNHPRKLFLLIGINDVSHGHSVDKLAARYERLVKKIRRTSPQTKLYIQSVMPINNDFRRYKNLIGREKTVKLFNERIEKIARDNDAVYIDLWPALADPATGKLKKQYTNDGLHLTGAGYRAWTELLRPYVDE